MSAVDERLGIPPLPPLTMRQRGALTARLVELIAIAEEQEPDGLTGPESDPGFASRVARHGLASDLLDLDLDDLAQAVTDRLHDRDRDRRANLTERPTP